MRTQTTPMTRDTAYTTTETLNSDQADNWTYSVIRIGDDYYILITNEYGYPEGLL